METIRHDRRAESRDASRSSSSKASARRESERAALTVDESVAVVARLAEDDDFRALFEVDCAAALRELGVPADRARSIVEGSANSVCKLASKQRFAELLPQLKDDAVRRALFFIIPQIRLS